ncbi:hypothetical protein CBR_g57826 [Chara braunii]|uniref:Dynein heavy chain linker domain-containing protein n=1 Tax=Chara braunii TaxID=69332 RepID=A0A388K8G6_CHABU|nr:hypothetical protein CBR_g57826 [Chara braunii]|eukprot:GBG66223.1 hypothetical protein CBR_g57826 [Chara braunii]
MRKRWLSAPCEELCGMPEGRHGQGGGQRSRATDSTAEPGQGWRQAPDTLEDLKFVLNIVAEVKMMSMKMELDYTDVEERYRTRELYDLPLDPAQKELAFGIRKRWMQLEDNAWLMDDALESTKRKFTEITGKEVTSFAEATIEFRDRMMQQGPGTVTDLDEGLELMKKFQGELATKHAKRDQLVLAQKLFDLPITSYPELLEIENLMKDLVQIYQLYTDFSATVKQSSSMLWAELDIQKLLAGTDEFVIRAKRMKALKSRPTFGLVEGKIKGFQDSLPLIQDLKSEALRKRHWEKLMQVTGKSFEMDTKTFTLAKLFAMELHNFANVISEITTTALKELNIEQEIKKLTDTWKDQKFDVAKYTKGGLDRGWVLRSTDEVQLLLEDMGLNMQSMTASRYVKPFLDEVRRWEGKLSLIGEVIDAWMQVQRKWMYLESIFVGSDDIRNQLPEEAKRFDVIDKNWKKIMADTARNPNILEACSVESRLDTLRLLAQQLETCQKSLSE